MAEQAFQTLTNYAQALKAGPSDPSKATGSVRAVRPETNSLHKIRRGSWDIILEPKLKSPIHQIAPKPLANPPVQTATRPQPQQSSYTMPDELQIFHTQLFDHQFQKHDAQPFESQLFHNQPLLQQLYARTFQLQQVLDAMPFEVQQLYVDLLQQEQADALQIQQQLQLDAQRRLQQQQVYAKRQRLQRQLLDGHPFQQQQVYGQRLQPQPLHAHPFQLQKLDTQPLYAQQLYVQPFQLQASSTVAMAEPAGSIDHLFDVFKPTGGIEHPQPSDTILEPCRPHCPYLNKKSCRLENHDKFKFSKSNGDEDDCSSPECQAHTGETSVGEYFTPMTLKMLQDIRKRVRDKIK